ncbi:MAG: hypothetical protein ACOCWO_00900 [Candidatus Muiribacteriaceae bacterium]
MFHKIEVLGNDFVFIPEDSSSEIDVIRICSRNRGVGADGIVFFDISDDSVSGRLVNSDGSAAGSMGNALSCLAMLYNSLTGKKSGKVFEENAAHSFILDQNSCEMNMGPVRPVSVGKDFFTIESGNRHRVYLREKIITHDIEIAGRRNPLWNIEHVVEKKGEFFVKVYETGVGFTSGCATAAAAVVSVIKPQPGKRMYIAFDGGRMTAVIDREDNIILTSGPCYLFTGELKGDWYV